MTIETLKPCPFCGEVNVEELKTPLVSWSQCVACGAEGSTSVHWNTRALAPALDVVIAEVEAWPENTALFPTGDPNTLRSIGKGSLLRDLRALRAAETVPETQDE